MGRPQGPSGESQRKRPVPYTVQFHPLVKWTVVKYSDKWSPPNFPDPGATVIVEFLNNLRDVSDIGAFVRSFTVNCCGWSASSLLTSRCTLPTAACVSLSVSPSGLAARHMTSSGNCHKNAPNTETSTTGYKHRTKARASSWDSLRNNRGICSSETSSAGAKSKSG